MAKRLLQSLHAKGYVGSWKNPLFTDPKADERSRDRLRYTFYTLLVIAALCTCLSLFFWFIVQERFALTHVRAEGMRSLPNELIAQDVLYELIACKRAFAPCLYTWNVQEQYVHTSLKQKYALEQVSIGIQEHELIIQVREAVTLIPLRIGQHVWFANKSGVLQFQATPEDITKGILVPPDVYKEIDVSAIVNGNPEEGMHILSPETFAQIAGYQKAFASRGISITSYACTQDAGKMIANTEEGFAIFFTPWEDAEAQVQRLTSVLKEEVPQRYADIRFGERIYIK